VIEKSMGQKFTQVGQELTYRKQLKPQQSGGRDSAVRLAQHFAADRLPPHPMARICSGADLYDENTAASLGL
jgi:hypothetical protein